MSQQSGARSKVDRAAIQVGAVLCRRSAMLRDEDGTPDYIQRIGLVLGPADDLVLARGWCFLRNRREHLVVGHIVKKGLVLEAISLRKLPRKWRTEETEIRFEPEIAQEIKEICGWAGPGPYPWNHPVTKYLFPLLDRRKARKKREEEKAEVAEVLEAA